MAFLNRLIPWTVSIIIFFLLYQIIENPKQVAWAISISTLIVLLSLFQLSGKNLKNEKFWRFSITPVLFFISSSLFLSFLEGEFLKQFFIFVVAVFLGVYLEVIYLWFNARPKYQAHSLDNISTHIDLLTIFFTATGFSSLIVFVGLSVWYLVLAFAIISGLLTYQLIWTSSGSVSPGRLYVVVISLVATEIFIVTRFLPTSIYVNGMIVTLTYYLMTGLARNWILEVKEMKVVKRYFIISIISLVLILLSAKWF